MIVFKLGFLVGLVLASPIILWQLWAFLAPALYEREKRALVPALFVGLLLFLTGAALAYVFVVPQALRVLFSFQTEAIQPFITYDNYFDFVLQVVLALGLSFELPLVIIILAWLGVIGAARAGTGSAATRSWPPSSPGAVLSPGTDLVSMIMMTIPLLLLYEVGSPGAVVIQRRRRKAAAIAGAGAARARARRRPRPRRRSPPSSAGPPAPRRAALDSLRGHRPARSRARRSTAPPPAGWASRPRRPGASRPTTRCSTAAQGAARLPVHPLPRRLGDRVHRRAQRVLLQGQALTERQGAHARGRHDPLPARTAACSTPSGDPHLFDRGQVLVGEGIRYDTCRRRGIVDDALTNFTEGSTVWFLRGNVAQDSSSSRIYAGSSEITSCDLPDAALPLLRQGGEVGLEERAGGAAGGAVRARRPDPLAAVHLPGRAARGATRASWCPSSASTTWCVPRAATTGRSPTSGTTGRRTTTSTSPARLDWFANRYVQYGVTGQYRWLNRFVSGTVGFNEQREVGGGSGLTFRWDHRQQFNLSTSLNFNVNYASNTARHPRERHRSAAEHAADHQLAQLLQALRLGHADAGRQPAPEPHRRQRAAAAAGGHALARCRSRSGPTSPGRRGSASPTTPPRTRADSLVRALPGGALDTVALDATLARHRAELRHAAPVRLLQLAELGAGRPIGRTGRRARPPSWSTTRRPPIPTDSVTGAPDLPERLPEHRSTGIPASTCRCCSAAPGRFSRWWASPTRPADRSRSATGTPTAASFARASASASAPRRRRRCSPSSPASGR